MRMRLVVALVHQLSISLGQYVAILHFGIINLADDGKQVPDILRPDYNDGDNSRIPSMTFEYWTSSISD
jgi:hypothetical protein